MQRKNVNPFKIHFLYLLSFLSLSMSLLSCRMRREWQTEKGMETMSRTFDSIVLFCFQSLLLLLLFFFRCVYLNNLVFMGSSVCTCNQFKWLKWSTFITTVFVCELFFTAFNSFEHIYSRFRQRFCLTEFFYSFILCFLFFFLSSSLFYH